jgi:DNA-binding phage protein
VKALQKKKAVLKEKEVDVFDEIIDLIGDRSITLLGELAEVSPQTIYLWLNGTTKKPRLDTLMKVGKVLGYRITLVKAKVTHLKAVR